MPDDAFDAWKGFLDPEVTRPRLLNFSIFVAGFEVFNDYIVRQPKDFLLMPYADDKKKGDNRYKNEVLSLDKDPVIVSLIWFRNAGAIDNEDIELFRLIRKCRNAVVHELLPRLIEKGFPVDFEKRFLDMIALFRKIDTWWVIEIVVPSNPDFDGSDVKDQDVFSALPSLVEILYHIAFSKE